MKKLLSLFVAFALSVGLMAQSQHMKFLGIPLNGTISTFHHKLVAKGYKHDVESSKIVSVNDRVFTGTFFGENANVHVYYNPKTKIVYRAKACIYGNSEELITQKFNEVKVALEKKYADADIEKDGPEGCNSMGFYTSQGRIDLYVSKQDDTSDVYTLHIDYWDDENHKKNENSKMNDL